MHRVSPIQFGEIEQRVPINFQRMQLIKQAALEGDSMNLIYEFAVEHDGTNAQHPMCEIAEHQHANQGQRNCNERTDIQLLFVKYKPRSKTRNKSERCIGKKR